MLNKYKIMEKVGRGGMGLVYKALDIKLGRVVALKELILNEALMEPERANCIARFKREAQTAAMLNHPNIVSVFDFGEFENRHFISMEFLRGKSLKEFLDEKYEFSLDELINFFIQTAEGLEFAHLKKVIHRDIKPANIQIISSNIAKITDFGLARFEDMASTLTKDGVMFGTIGYMSPEQLKNSRKVDFRADIFSFGAMMYELVTGKLAFGGETIAETVYKILTEEPEPIKNIVQDFPESLEKIISKCLKKNIEERYQSTSNVLNDIKALSSRYGQIIISPPKAEKYEISNTVFLDGIYNTKSGNTSDTQKIFPQEKNILSKESLQNGQKFYILNKIGVENFSVCINWDAPPDFEIECCALLLSETEKLEKEENFVFYNNLYSSCKSVIIDSSENQLFKKLIEINLNNIPDEVFRIKFFLSIDNSSGINDKIFSKVKIINVNLITSSGKDLNLKIENLTSEVTLVFAEIYRRKGKWKFQACMDGYKANLAEFLKKHASEKIVIEEN